MKIKTTAPRFLIIFALGCFALCPTAQAVIPSPDGGYPGGNTAEGQNALLSLTTGGYNTAVGFFSLRSDTTASFNTGFGAGALFGNNADDNCAFGVLALFSNTGPANSAFGYGALASNTSNANAAFGAYALLSNTSGNFNTASGYAALQNNTTGVQNTADGSGALLLNTTGSYNTAVGVNALLNNGAGSNHTCLGYNSGSGILGGNNIITVGNVSGISSLGGQVDNSCYIDNIYNAVVGSLTPVYVDFDGKLGTTLFSSQRFKKEVREMSQISKAVLALKPVTFQYKYDKKGVTQFGLIAEEVEKVNRDLVVRDKDGKPYSVRYDQVNVMLLNEFLKEHRKVEKLEATVMEQQKQIKVLTSGLQKVAAEVELSKKPKYQAALQASPQ